ncbi:hypothetical protein GPECTOR_7g1185 [Gonium pectorale]|uniref:HSP70 protein n=1 Tax=Gonium pectorale TaxID=33097 RepID=A0A150GTZ4_GONPE|nr:hypothetical protein GPECTOR_7g1185 [Gonium pectorale]|eukprot:KXZ53291.1 hypothetical protein GPECTOR_7g1185 [Gonium pectorale]
MATRLARQQACPAHVIGIDFGTHASGFAIIKTETATGIAAQATTHDRWPDQPTPDAKTRTALLYRGDEVVAWGWTAVKRWTEMSSTERASHTYLEHFKLLLEDGAADGVDTVCPLPPGVTREQAVADFLAAMLRYLRGHLRRTGVILNPEEATWALTVPAIWSDAAKARMRKAAHLAGLTTAVKSASLLLALEPEAAALAAAMAGEASPTSGFLQAPASVSLAGTAASGVTLVDGDVVLVLDCGGGTVDVTLHGVRGNGVTLRLEEKVAGRGALAGGAHVDAAAMSLVRELLGGHVWDDWKEDHPAELTRLKAKWELSKRAFYSNRVAIVASSTSPAFGTGGCRPTALIARPAHVRNGDLRLQLPERLAEQCTVLSTPSRDRGWVSADGSLVLSAEVVAKEVFDPVVDQVLQVMADMLYEGYTSGATCNKVLLVGGFARSPYLQARVRQAMPAGTSLLLPTDPGAAVVAGAAIFGALPALVSGRRTRLSYGVNMARPWTSEDAIHAASDGVPTKFWHEEKKSWYALGTYNEFVKRNELVDVGHITKKTFCPLYKTQTSVEFKLYGTCNSAASYTTDSGMQELASVTLELPTGWARTLSRANEYSVEVEFRFGCTELSMIATDARSRNAVAATVVWDADLV